MHFARRERNWVTDSNPSPGGRTPNLQPDSLVSRSTLGRRGPLSPPDPPVAALTSCGPCPPDVPSARRRLRAPLGGSQDSRDAAGPTRTAPHLWRIRAGETLSHGARAERKDLRPTPKGRGKVPRHGATPGGYGGKPPGVAFIGVPTGARNAGCGAPTGDQSTDMNATRKPPRMCQDLITSPSRVSAGDVQPAVHGAV